MKNPPRPLVTDIYHIPPGNLADALNELEGQIQGIKVALIATNILSQTGVPTCVALNKYLDANPGLENFGKGRIIYDVVESLQENLAAMQADGYVEPDNKVPMPKLK